MMYLINALLLWSLSFCGCDPGAGQCWVTIPPTGDGDWVVIYTPER